MKRQYTREMIRDEFVGMLEERPLDEITVTDLVARCEFNRKTFYYYYQDIYAVLAELFETELARVIAVGREKRRWEDGFVLAVEIAIRHKRAIYHVYHSMQRETLESYLFRIAGDVMTRYVQQESEGIHAAEADQKIIASFYQCALTQMVLSWIAQGMKEDGVQLIGRIGRLFDGNIRLSLRRSETLPAWNASEDADRRRM